MAECRLALACAIMLSNAGAPARSVLKIIESPAMPDRSVARRMTPLGREKTRCQRPSKYQIQKNDIEVIEMPAHCSQKLGGSN
jgi:hypothetical protein